MATDSVLDVSSLCLLADFSGTPTAASSIIPAHTHFAYYAMLAWYWLWPVSLCLSVRPSVTSRYYVEKADQAVVGILDSLD